MVSDWAFGWKVKDTDIKLHGQDTVFYGLGLTNLWDQNIRLEIIRQISKMKIQNWL